MTNNIISNISIIAAVDINNGLGIKNKIPWYLPADLEHFKKITMGKTIFMGRKTFESIGNIPLMGRSNIIISNNHMLSYNNVIIVNSINHFFKITKFEKEVMVVGGQTIYKQMLPFASKIYLTIIHSNFTTDVFFPILDTSWKLINSVFRNRDTKNIFDITFCTFYRN